jgi:hypothetical protein
VEEVEVENILLDLRQVEQEVQVEVEQVVVVVLLLDPVEQETVHQ